MNRRYPPILFVILILAITATLIFFGCGDTGTTVVSDDEVDDDDDSGVDDDDDDGFDDTPPPPPSGGGPRCPPHLDNQSFTGTTEPGAFIKVYGGAQEASIYADVETGDFCVVVSLILNETNILSVTAQDADGNVSDPTNISITQNRNNICLEAQADAASVSYSEPNNVPGNAIDGAMLTYWANTTQPWHIEALRSPQWFRVELKEVETISRIDIYWTDNGYGIDYEVYVSDSQEEPVKPHADANWKDEYTLVAEQTNPTSGFNGHNTFDLSQDPMDAKWILVAFI